MAETIGEIRDKLIALLAASKTLAETRVTAGRRIPLENPMAAVVPELDKLPLITVSVDSVDYDNSEKSRKRVLEEVRLQVCGYVVSDYEHPSVDEDVDRELDELARQIVRALQTYYAAGPHTEAVPKALRLPHSVELEVSGFDKPELPAGEHSCVVGAVRVSLQISYHRKHELPELPPWEGGRSVIKAETVKQGVEIPGA